MVHYLSGFAGEDLSRFISSTGGDIDGSDKVSAKSQDEGQGSKEFTTDGSTRR